jgi:hypothetical protein
MKTGVLFMKKEVFKSAWSKKTIANGNAKED